MFLPPGAVKTVGDLIFWQYAKIISESAGAGKRQYAFVMDRFKKLVSGEILWSTSIREYVKEREKTGECIYCGCKKDLDQDFLQFIDNLSGVSVNSPSSHARFLALENSTFWKDPFLITSFPSSLIMRTFKNEYMESDIIFRRSQDRYKDLKTGRFIRKS